MVRKFGVKREVNNLGWAVKFLDIQNIWLGKARVFFLHYSDFFSFKCFRCVAFRFVVCGYNLSGSV